MTLRGGTQAVIPGICAAVKATTLQALLFRKRTLKL